MLELITVVTNRSVDTVTLSEVEMLKRSEEGVMLLIVKMVKDKISSQLVRVKMECGKLRLS